MGYRFPHLALIYILLLSIQQQEKVTCVTRSHINGSFPFFARVMRTPTQYSTTKKQTTNIIETHS